MPTAVITESSEKTMSSSAIWTMTQRTTAAPSPAAVRLVPASSLSWISRVALAMRNRPPHEQDQVAPGEARARAP